MPKAGSIVIGRRIHHDLGSYRWIYGWVGNCPVVRVVHDSGDGVMDPITVTAFAFSIASYHFDREVKHNEINPGMFVELNHDYILGVYRNSNYRTTVLAARQFHLVSWRSVNVGAMAGVCTGYDFVLPVCGAATVEYRGVTLAVIPPVTATGGVVGLSYRHAIK